MANGFVSADLEKFARFKTDSAAAITEFNSIKNKFNEINSTLLSKWKGEGADAYRKESDHILENIGGIKDVLDGLNESISDVVDTYNNLDEELGAYNRNPSDGNGG